MHPVHDHVDTALALLVQQFQDKERIRFLLGALVSQVQGVEDTLWDLHIARRLARAAGAQLDGIGRIVGLRRGRLIEESYRTYLRAQIRLLRSHGTPEDLLAMVSLIVGPEVSVELDGNHHGPRQFLSVSVGRRLVLDHLFLPDASPADSLSDRVRISASSVLPIDPKADRRAMADAWRDIPIRVQLTGHERYEDLDFVVAPGALPFEDRFLIERSGVGEKQ